jgi:hypothetical protein
MQRREATAPVAATARGSNIRAGISRRDSRRHIEIEVLVAARAEQR